MRPWWKRFLCLFWHSWVYPGPSLRTCRLCGKWEQYVVDMGGMASGHWVPYP